MGWDAALHPRAPAGSAAGGQFMSYDSSKDSGTGYDKKEGDTRVKELQQALNKLGFTDANGKPLKVDGKLGPLTTEAIKKAQQKLGVKADGKVDASFVKKLTGHKGDAKGKSDHGKLSRGSSSKTKTEHGSSTSRRRAVAKPTPVHKSSAKPKSKPKSGLSHGKSSKVKPLAKGKKPERLTHIGAKKRAVKEKPNGNVAGREAPVRQARNYEADNPKMPYGDVSYADPGYQKDGKKRYPLDSADHCRAAWSYINMPKNAAQYSPTQVASIKSRIKAAAKKYGIAINDSSAAKEALMALIESGDDMKATHDGGRVLESKGEDEIGGRIYRVRVIKYGDSRNKRRYPESVMRTAARLYEGAKAYDHHRDDAELRSSTVHGLVGWYENVQADTDGLYADLHLLPSAGKVSEALDATLALQERNLPPLVGTSHDVTGSFRPINEKGRIIQEATAITAVASVDIVANPAAGGQAVRAVAGGDEDSEGEDMTLEEMLAKLADASDEQLAAAGLARSATEATEPEEGSEGEGEGEGEETDEVTESEIVFTRSSAVGKLTVKTLVEDAGLPAQMRESLIEGLPERFTESDIVHQIAQLKTIYGAFEKANLIPKAAPGEGVGTEELDKKRKALEAFFSGDFGNGYWSFRQAYMDWTGKAPRSFTEDFNRQILRESISRYDSRDRVTESMVSTSWDVVLGDSITRRMVAEYQVPGLQTWRQIVSQVTPVNDFRTQRIDRIGGYGTLPAVNEAATYQPLTSPTDEEVTYAITKRGGTEDITLEMIANDDVRSISRIPVKLGRAAAQTLYRFVWELVNPTTNATIYDGVALYHANHANTDTNALSASAVSTGRQKMRDQAAYNDSNEILSLVPKFLLVPNELEELAWEIVTSAVALPSGAPVGAASNIPNLHQGLNLLVMDYWTDATAWAMVADPTSCPTIEMGFYQGRDTPELFTQSDPTQGSMFDSDKLTYKIRHIYSGTVLDYRAFYRGNT